MEFGWGLRVSLHRVSNVFLFPLRQPIDRTPLLLGEPRGSRLRHGVTHRFAIQVVSVQVDDIDFWFDAIEKSARLLIVGLGLSPNA